MAGRIATIALVLVVAAAAAGAADPPATPKWGGTWQSGPATTFVQAFMRFDGAYFQPTGLVYFLGGRMADNNTNGRIYTFNPVTGVYADTGIDMPIPISNYNINVLNDSTGPGFYLFCGRTSGGTQNYTVQIYYPATNTTATLTAADNYPGTTCSAALNVVYNNKVYISGGFDGTAMNGTTWVFDPMAAVGSKWTQLSGATLAQPLAYVMGAEVNGLIYAIGGAYWDGVSALINVATVQVLDPAAPTPSWNDAAVADLPETCSSSDAWGFSTGSLYQDPVDLTPLAGKIITGCGNWSTANANAYAYTVATNTWASFPTLVTARRDQAADLISLASAPALWFWGGYDSTGAGTTASEYYSLALVPVELQSFTVE